MKKVKRIVVHFDDGSDVGFEGEPLRWNASGNPNGVIGFSVDFGPGYSVTQSNSLPDGPPIKPSISERFDGKPMTEIPSDKVPGGPKVGA